MSPSHPLSEPSRKKLSLPESSRAADLFLRLVPLGAFLCFAALAIDFLYRAHPAEDAFILFKYVENLAGGHGLAFYPGGPHAEGGTDFLWLVWLSLLRRLGLDVAVAAALSNALGAGLSAHLLCEVLRRSSLGSRARIVFGASVLAVVLVPGTIAGLFGFSTTLYSALSLSLFALCLWGDRSLPFLPLAGLVVGLFRPDGVILAVAFGAIGWLRARQLGRQKPFLVASAAAVVLGAAYFAWRAWYFGHLLPLPLYVKAHASSGRSTSDALLLAWKAPFGWLAAGPESWCVAVAFLGLAGLSIRRRAREVAELLMCLSAYLVFVAALSNAHQIQNIASRFQAPLQLAFVFSVYWLAARAWEVHRHALVRASVLLFLCLAIVPSAWWSARVFDRYRRNHTYVDTFAPELGRLLPAERTLALTEAGRLAYWTEARVEDLFGLNTAYTALRPPDVDYLRSVSPDVILFHAGSTGLNRRFKGRPESVLPIELQDLIESLPPSRLETLEDGLAAYDASHLPGQVVPALVLRYLRVTPGFSLHVVRYAGSFDHVYALRAGLPETPRILAALESVASGAVPYRPYSECAGLPFARSEVGAK